MLRLLFNCAIDYICNSSLKLVCCYKRHLDNIIVFNLLSRFINIMDSNKRRSLLKKKTDVEEAQLTNRPKRRISFSGKKAIREFSKENVAKCWDHSYEVSDLAISAEQLKLESGINSVSKCSIEHSTRGEAHKDLSASSKSLSTQLQLNITQDVTLLPFEKTHKKQTDALSESSIVPEDTYLGSFSLSDKDRLLAGRNRISVLEEETVHYMRDLSAYRNVFCSNEESEKKASSRLDIGISDSANNQYKNQVNIMKMKSSLSRQSAVNISDCDFEMQSVDKENTAPNKLHTQDSLPPEQQYSNITMKISSGSKTAIPSKTQIFSVENDMETSDICDSFINKDTALQEKSVYSQKSSYDLKDMSKIDFTELEGNKSILDDISLNTNNSTSFYSPILDSSDLPPEFSCGKKYNLRQLNDCIEKGKLRLFCEEDLTPLVKRNNLQQTIRSSSNMDIENMQLNKRGTLFFNNDENKEMNNSVLHLSEPDALGKKETVNLKGDRFRFSQADEILMNNTNFLAQAKLGDETLSRNSSKSGSISNSKRTTVYYDDNNIICDGKMNENPQNFINAEALRAKLKLFRTGAGHKTLEAINQSEFDLQLPTLDTSLQKENTFDYIQESLHSEKHKQSSADIKKNFKNNDNVLVNLIKHDEEAQNKCILREAEPTLTFEPMQASEEKTLFFEKSNILHSMPREKAEETNVNTSQKESNIYHKFKTPKRRSIYDPSDMEIEDDFNILNETKKETFILPVNENDILKNNIDNGAFSDEKLGSNIETSNLKTTRESNYYPSGMEIDNKFSSPKGNIFKSMDITAKEHFMEEHISKEEEQVVSHFDNLSTDFKLGTKKRIHVPTATDLQNEEPNLSNKSNSFILDNGKLVINSTLPTTKQVIPSSIPEDDLQKRRASLYCITGMDVVEDLNLSNALTSEEIPKESKENIALKNFNEASTHNPNFLCENVQLEEMDLTKLMHATCNSHAINGSKFDFGVGSKVENQFRKTIYYNCNLYDTINEKINSPSQEELCKNIFPNEHANLLYEQKKHKTFHSNDDMQIEEDHKQDAFVNDNPKTEASSRDSFLHDEHKSPLQEKIKMRQTTYPNEDVEIDIQKDKECNVGLANEITNRKENKSDFFEIAKMDNSCSGTSSQKTTIKSADKKSMFYMKETIVETNLMDDTASKVERSVKEPKDLPFEECPEKANDVECKSRFQSTIYDIDDLDIEKVNDTNVSIESATDKQKPRKTICLNEDLELEENEKMINLSFHMRDINIQDDDDLKSSGKTIGVCENKYENLRREVKLGELDNNNSQLNRIPLKLGKARNTVFCNEDIEFVAEQYDGLPDMKQRPNAIKGRETVYINEEVELDEVALSKTANSKLTNLTENTTSRSKYIFEEIDLITENINYKMSKASANVATAKNNSDAGKEDCDLQNSFELMKERNFTDCQRKTMIFVNQNDIKTDEANATNSTFVSDLVKDEDSIHSSKEEMVNELKNDKTLFEIMHKKPCAEIPVKEAKLTVNKSLSRLIQSLKKSSYETPKKKVYNSVEMTPLTKPKSLLDSLICRSLLDFEDMEQECGFESPNKSKSTGPVCDISEVNKDQYVQRTANESHQSHLTVVDMETDANKTCKNTTNDAKTLEMDMDISFSKDLDQKSFTNCKRLSQNMTPNLPFAKKRQTVQYKDSHIVEEVPMHEKTIDSKAVQQKTPRKLELFPDEEPGERQVSHKSIDKPELGWLLMEKETQKENEATTDCSLKQPYHEPIDIPRRLNPIYERHSFLHNLEMPPSANVLHSENIEKFYNITLGTKPSEDIEKTHLSLVETILDDTEDESLPLPTIDLTYSNKKAGNTINTDAFQVETRTQHKESLCKKCKGCDWPIPNENDMSLIDQNKYKQKFSFPDMKTIRSKQMSSQPTIKDILRTRMRESLANAMKLSDIQDEEVSENKISLKEVFRKEFEHSAYRIAELERSFRVPSNQNIEHRPLKEAMMQTFCNDSAEMKQKLSELKQMLQHLRTPQKSFIERLQIIMKTNNKNWLFNTKLQAMNKFIFYHRKIETSLIEINYEEIDDGANIRVKNVKSKRHGFSYNEWQPIHHVLEFQLQLELPYPDLIGYCPGSDELSICDMLSRFDHIFLNVKKMVLRFWFTIMDNGGSLIRDGPSCYVKKVVRRSKNLNGGIFLNQHYTIYIAVRDIPKLSFKDITRPALHLFDESITELPIGLEFITAFLGNPLKFIKPESCDEHAFL